MAAETETKELVKASGKFSFEEALDKTGFGSYSYSLMSLTGLIVISSACILFGGTITVPTSACELKTSTSQQGILAAVPFIGGIFGSVVCGYLGDRFGRRRMAILSLCAGAALNALLSISIDWIMFLVILFLSSIVASGQYVLAMTILSESVPLSKRNVALLLVASIFLLSQGLMAVIAMPIIPLSYSIYFETLGIYWNSWRTLVLVYSIPSLMSATWLFFMQESPKYRFAKGDEEGALRILRIIHKCNNGRNSVFEVQGILEEPKLAENVEASGEVRSLFRMPLLKYTLILSCLFIFQQVGAFVVWLPKVADKIISLLETGDGADLSLCGIIASNFTQELIEDPVPCSLNTTSLLFVLGVAATQSVMNILMSLFINKVGRRNMAMVITGTCGLAGVLINLVPNAYGSLALYAIFLMGLLVIGLYTAIGVSVFPTDLRATALSLAQACGRVSVFFCIQILNMLLNTNCQLGFYVFATMFGCSAIIASFLPDDRFVVATRTNADKTQDEENTS